MPARSGRFADVSPRDGARVDVWLAAIAAAATFLLFRPYLGIVHDARLYVGFALAPLDPDGVGRDLVFVHDGQSRLSVFRLILRVLLEWGGPVVAAAVVTYAGLLLWFAALVAFVRSLLGTTRGWSYALGVALLAVSLSPGYGPQRVFQFAEAFATPRALAEACVLAALAALLARRTGRAIGLLGLGLTVHPLMTAPAAAVALWFAVGARVRLLLVLVAGVVVAGVLGTAMMAPATTGMLARFDTEWLRALNYRSSIVFLRHWESPDAARLLLHLVTTVLGATVLGGRAGRLMYSVIAVVAGALLVTWVGADLVGHVLVTQGQPWRALWMLAILAALMMGVVLDAAWRAPSPDGDVPPSRDLRRAATVLLLLAWFVVDSNAATVLFVLLSLLLWSVPIVAPTWRLPAMGLAAITTLAALFVAGVVTMQSWELWSAAAVSPDPALRGSWETIVGTGIPGVLVLAAVSAVVSGAAWALPWRFPRLLGALVPLALLILLARRGDARSTYQRAVEHALDDRYAGRPPDPVLRADGPVYWAYANLEPWAFAGSAGWAANPQGISIVFDRALALRWRARWERLAALGLAPENQLRGDWVAARDAVITPAHIDSLCRPPDAPALLVLPVNQLRGPSADDVVTPPAVKPLRAPLPGAVWQRIDAYRVIRCAVWD